MTTSLEGRDLDFRYSTYRDIGSCAERDVNRSSLNNRMVRRFYY